VDDWAILRGVLVGMVTPIRGGESTPLANKVMNLLLRERDGTWKHVWDIWNPKPLGWYVMTDLRLTSAYWCTGENVV